MEIVGDAGIGKSALLREFAVVAHQQGMVVLTGSGGRREPFAVFADTLVGHGEPGRHTPHPEHRAADERASPTSVERGRQVGESTDAEIQECCQEVRSLLERFATDRVVFILDDLHSADTPSLEVLAQLLHRPPTSRVMFVLGYRDRQAPVALQLAVTGSWPRLPVTRLWLPPLSERDVDAMLGEDTPATWRAWLYRTSGGNPAYLRALLAEQAADAGTVDTASDLGAGASFTYAPFLAELAATSRTVREVAEAAAVVGPEFDAKLVSHMLDRPEPEILHAIGELISVDLIRPVVHGPYFRYRHPVVRRAAYHNIELSRRIALHIRADDVLRARGADATERAVHVEQWASHGDLDAVQLLEAAADRIDTTRPGRAASWLAAALRLLPQRPDLSERRALLLVRLARAHGMAGNLRACRDLMHAALRLIPTSTATVRAEAVAFTAMVQRLLGAHAETDALLQAEIARAEDDTLAAAALRFELAAGQLKTGDSVTCRQWAGQALAIARKHQDRPMQAACLALLAKAAIGDGHADAAGYLAQASSMLDAMLDDEFARSLDAVEWVGWSEVMMGRWDNALRHFGKAVEFAVRADQRLTLPRLLLGQVFALHTRGRLAEAREAAEHAVELAEQSGSPEQLLTAHSLRLWNDNVLGREGGPPEELRSIGYPREVASNWRDTLALRLLAEARLMSGDHEGALALVGVVGGTDLPGCAAYSRVAWYELCTRAELAAGRVDEAAKWAELAVATAAPLGQPGRTGLALLAQAQVRLAQAPETALAPARQAMLRLEEAGLTLDTFRARHVHGVALYYQGKYDAAVRELKATQLAFEQLGAAALARRAGTDRRRLAAREPRTREAVGTENAETLTTREHQVAHLVREGLTNRLIARKLYISEKTVEMHLSRVFVKLGVSSRAAVAAFVTREWPKESTTP